MLLTNDHELELARLIDEKGGVMVMNGAPETRSWFRNALTARRPTLNENENGCSESTAQSPPQLAFQGRL